MTKSRYVAEALADDERQQSRSAVLLWLRHSGGVSRDARVRMGVTIMCGSVATQAVLLGVVRCGYCMDGGCHLCTQPTYKRRGMQAFTADRVELEAP